MSWDHYCWIIRIWSFSLPIVIGVIIGVDTMIKVIFLLYLPPLAVFHKDKETTGAIFVAEGMIGVAYHHVIDIIVGSIDRHVLSRLRIECPVVILHEACMLLSHFHQRPTVIHIAVRCTRLRTICLHECAVGIFQFGRRT